MLRLILFAWLELCNFYWTNHDLGPELRYVGIFVNLAAWPVLGIVAMTLIVVTCFLAGFTLDNIVTVVSDLGGAVERVIELVPSSQSRAQEAPEKPPWDSSPQKQDTIETNDDEGPSSLCHEPCHSAIQEGVINPHNSPVKAQRKSITESPPTPTPLTTLLQPNERLLLSKP